MEINWQFQDLHGSGDLGKWILKQRIERDVLLLYHQLSDYSYVMGDLYYGSVYDLPYWDHLNFMGIAPDERDFLREGCLVMVLAMAFDLIDGSGSHLFPHLATCRDKVRLVEPSNEDQAKLVETVLLALNAAENHPGESETPELTESAKWVHQRYVRGYFRGIAARFDEDPYFVD